VSKPSSQTIAIWIKAELQSVEWTPLESVCLGVVQKLKLSKNELSDLIEEYLPHISEHLRNDIAECEVDGVKPAFEIDNEQPPYIRKIELGASDIATKMRRIDPYDFEKICAAVLEKLGGQSQTTKQTNDGGVDFVAVNMKLVPEQFNVPTACRAAVIGQAKRFKETNPINEVRLREFVGAATLHRHRLHQDRSLGPLTPVLCAFWTTSYFDSNAKKYAREVGIWYMDGQTLADYVDGLGLRDYVMNMQDKQP
jgi:hypothetical protein